MKKLFLITFLLLIFQMAYGFSSCENKMIWGKIEKATLIDKDVTVDAKIDTGAEMSSLSAINIKFFTYYNKPWVQFTLPLLKNEVTFIEPLKGTIQILNRENERANFSAEKYTRRPVIIVKIKIGNKIKNLQVNLVDRRQFHYPLLIGSDAIKKYNVCVDVTKDHLSGKNL